MNKKALSERDICTKFITPALRKAGWDEMSQIREEVSFTKGRIIVRGKLHTRGKQKRADHVLYYAPNLPIAVIEAKDNKHTLAAGMQQALGYAEALDTPFAFSSNGDGFLMHDRTGQRTPIEQELALDEFPGPEELWQRYCCWKGIASAEKRATVEAPYYDDGSGKAPHYYQVNAINRKKRRTSTSSFRRTSSIWWSSTNATAAAPPKIRRGVKYSITFPAPRTSASPQRPRNRARFPTPTTSANRCTPTRCGRASTTASSHPTRSFASTSTKTCKVGAPRRARPTSTAS